MYIPVWFIRLLPILPFIVYGLACLADKLGWLHEKRFDPTEERPLWYLMSVWIIWHPWEVMGYGFFGLGTLSALIVGSPSSN